MKIFFIAASDVDRLQKVRYRQIIKMLRKLNHQVDERIFNKLIEGELTKEIHFRKIHQDIMGRIKRAEVVVADISCPSGGVGYVVSQTLFKKKPVVILVFQDNETNPSVIMQGIKNKHAWVVRYPDLKDLRRKLSRILKSASSLKKVRFNLVMDGFEFNLVEQEAKRRNISKTRVIRDLIRKKGVNPIFCTSSTSISSTFGKVFSGNF